MRDFIQLIGLCLIATGMLRADDSEVQQFEQQVRPVLIDHCFKCHGALEPQGGLRLDARQTLLSGGDTGPAITAGSASQSLLWQRIVANEMPPITEPRLTMKEKEAIRQWLDAGAVMPDQAIDPAAAKDWRRLWSLKKPNREQSLASLPAGIRSSLVEPRALEGVEEVAPDSPAIKLHLQGWYRADDLPLKSGESVIAWPDRSGHARHLVPTQGAHPNGTGAAPKFQTTSTIGGRPAVRFDERSGIGSLGDKPVPILGDAE